MYSLPFSRPSVWILVPVLLAVSTLVPLRGFAYDTASQSCGFVAGLSTYATAAVPDSGRVDYGRGEWSMDSANINSAPSSRGTAIAPTDRLCFDEDGEVYGAYRWAWNNNFGWIDFGWCTAAIPGCDAYAPGVDFDNPTAYGAPWVGKAWNDNVGWIDFDWCATSAFSGCEAQEVHTVLPSPWPTTSTTATGQVRGYAWNDRVGWIHFGDVAGAVLQQLPNGTGGMVAVIPEVTISPDPDLATKYGGGTGVAAPKADAEDAYEIHVEFQIVDAAGNPTGVYLDPADYDVEVAVTTSAGSNFGAIKTDYQYSYTDGEDAVFWDSLFGDVSGNGYSWFVNSFAPTSNLNGYENATGAVTTYFDMDAAYTPLPNRDYYVIQDLDFTFTPLSGGPPVGILTGWNLGEIWDLKFAPLMEVTNLAYSPSEDDSQPFLSFLPSTLDTDFYVRGLVMNWDTSPTVETVQSPYTPLGFFPANGLYTNGFTAWYRTITEATPALPLGETALKFMYSTDGNSLSYPSGSVFMHSNETDYTDASYVSAFTSKVSSPPANQGVPTGVSTAKRLHKFGISPSPYVTDPEIVRLVSADLGSSTLDEAIYRSEIVYRVHDPLDSSRDVLVAYYSNRLSTTPTGVPLFIYSYPDSDPDGEAGEYPETSTVPGISDGLHSDAVIVGSVTGSSALQTVTSGGDITLIGNVSTYRVRNALFQRFSKLRKGMTPGPGPVTLTNDLNRPSSTGPGASLLGGDLLYFTGDVTLPLNVASAYDQKTIVVEGGDIYIKGDLDGSSALGLVAFQNYSGQGGNVYIDFGVKELHRVTIYADGSVRSTDRDTPNGALPTWQTVSSRQAALKNQLYIGGSLVAKNTIGGVLDGLLPTGLPATNTYESAHYDLNHLREFQVCWYAVNANPANPAVAAMPLTPYDFDGDGSTYLVNGNPDPGDLVDCPGYTRSPALDVTVSGPAVPLGNNNEPLRIEYIPPPASLPLLGEI